MTLIPIKTPNIVKKMFPNYIWDINTTEKIIYLTFDDGPTPEITNWTLDILKTYNAKATFFCIGNNIKKHPDIFKKTLNEGHSIGNHTLNHIKGWKTSTKTYIKELKETEALINSNILNPTLNTTKLFRPPFGKIRTKQGKEVNKLGYKIIMWDILSFDWNKNISPESCLQNVLTKTKNGSIIVFHDSVKASKNMQYALPKVLDFFNKKNYKFESLPI